MMGVVFVDLVIGCYTAGDYAIEAEERLLASVRALDLPHDVREYQSRGSWVKNGFACQTFLRQMHDEMPDVNFLFLDVDAVVRSDPWPFLRTLKCDAAAHYFRGKELLTGTLYLPAGPNRRRLLDEWIKLNELHPGQWDQINAQKSVLCHGNPHGFVFADLPAEYCCIFDLQRRVTPNIIPVIEHFQASRRLRRGADRDR